jgi:trans-2-enoyl-CoA reductase
VTTLQFSSFGDPAAQLECLTLESEIPQPEPEPEPGQVRLRLRFSPVHPSDINLIQGTYGIRPDLPAIPGGEASAIVDAIADGVTDLAVGDAVILRTRIGAWRELAIVDVANCFKLPVDFDLAQASMLRINPSTAWRMLQDFVELEAGDWILQNAANSAVGRCVIQLANCLGLRTINLVRRAELADELKAAGADAVFIDSGEKELGQQIAELTGDHPPRLALNAVGGDSALRLMDWLAPGGMHVTYGAMGMRPLKVPNRFLIFKNLQLRGFWLSEWQKHARREAIDAMLHTLAQHMVAGDLEIPVAEVFPPSECKAAIEAATSDRRSGKILFEFNAAG